MSKKLLVLSSGGDAPGMNAAIRAVVREGIYHGYQVFGCMNGFSGLLEQQIIPLHNESVANCIQRGGTILKSGRCPQFTETQYQQQARDYLHQQDFSALVVLGGNGSLQGARLLSADNSLQVISIPCTIDNDIPGTDYCIGFDTASNTALQAIDHIRDTALSHDHHFMVEVMGRASGFLAVDVGIAGGAEFIIIPEFPITPQQIVTLIKNKKREKLTSIIVNAEADQPGHSMQLAAEIKKISDITYRTCILGHIQRGGSPTVKDRRIATIMGARAVEAIIQGESDQMSAFINNKVQLVPMPTATQTTKHFERKDLLDLNAIVCGVA